MTIEEGMGVVAEPTAVERIMGLESMQAALRDLVGGARCSILIYTQALEPELYNDRAFAQRLALFVKKNPRNRIQILACKTRMAEQKGHRFIDLAQQLPSYVEIRSVPKELQRHQQSYFLVDDQRGFVWPNLSVKSANVLLSPSSNLAAMRRDFKALWDRCSSVSSLRRLNF